jgi:hypothetical protein
VTTRRTMRRQTLIRQDTDLPHCYGGVLWCSPPGAAFCVPRA